MSNVNLDTVLDSVGKELASFGIEIYPFHIAAYNDLVSDAFKLTAYNDRSAILTVSTPSMFETLFLPYVKSSDYNPESSFDPIDDCIRNKISSSFEPFQTHILTSIYDFEKDHGLRPRILMQTVGHVAGAAFYYRSTCAEKSSSLPLYGCSIHPKYGGNFAFRSVSIFTLPWNDVPPSPIDVFNGDFTHISALLKSFSFNWKGGEWRNLSNPSSVYSEMQSSYFNTLPQQRKELLNKWLTSSF